MRTYFRALEDFKCYFHQKAYIFNYAVDHEKNQHTSFCYIYYEGIENQMHNRELPV